MSTQISEAAVRTNTAGRTRYSDQERQLRKQLDRLRTTGLGELLDWELDRIGSLQEMITLFRLWAQQRATD